MLGVRSTHDPVQGEFARKLAKDIVEMYVHPVKEDKARIQYRFDWSRVDEPVCSLEDL